MARNLSGPCQPNLIPLRQNMLHGAAEGAQTEGLADDERVQHNGTHKRHIA
jgi:hypothetical protein